MDETDFPDFPLDRVIREGVGVHCDNCHSTMSKSGFLRLFGTRYCDNDECPNSQTLMRNRETVINRLLD